MKRLEPRVRAICNELIDEFIADGQLRRRARATPSTFRCAPSRTCSGIPEKDGDLFIKWIHQILELGIKRRQTR